MAQDIRVHRGVIEVTAGNTTASASITLHDTASDVVSDGHVFARRISSGCGSPVWNPSAPTTMQQPTPRLYASRVSLSAGSGTTLNITATVHSLGTASRLVAWEVWEYVGAPGGPNEFVAASDESATITTSSGASFPTFYGAATADQIAAFSNIVPMQLGEEYVTAGDPGLFGEQYGVYQFQKGIFLGSGFFTVKRNTPNSSHQLRAHMTPVAFVGSAWYAQYFSIAPSVAPLPDGAWVELERPVDWDHTLPLSLNKFTPSASARDYGAAIIPNETRTKTVIVNGLPNVVNIQVAVSEAASGAQGTGALTGWLLSSGNMSVEHKRSNTYGADLTQVSVVTTDTFGLGEDPRNHATGIGETDFTDFATSYGWESTGATLSFGSHLANPTLVDNGPSQDMDVEAFRSNKDGLNVSPNVTWWLHLATFRDDNYDVQQPNTASLELAQQTAESVDFKAYGSAGAFAVDPSVVMRDGSFDYVAYPQNASEPAILSFPGEGLGYQSPSAGTVQIRKTYETPFAASSATHLRLVFRRVDNEVIDEFAFCWRRTTDTQDFTYGSALSEGRAFDLDPDYFVGPTMHSVLVDLTEQPSWNGDINAFFLHSKGASGSQGVTLRLDSWRLYAAEPDSIDLGLAQSSAPASPVVATASMTNVNAMSSAPFAPRYAQSSMGMALDVDATATVEVPVVFDPDLSLDGLQVVSQGVSASEVPVQGILARLTAQVQVQATLETDETLTASLTESQNMEAKE